MAAPLTCFSYAMAAAAFVVLSLLLLTRWSGQPAGRALAGACLWAVGWGGVLAWQAAVGKLPLWLLETVELVRSGAWSVLLLLLAAPPRRPGAPAWRSWRQAPALLPGVLALYACCAAATLLPMGWGAYLAFYPAVLMRIGMALLGMLLVEQLYRNRRAEQQWAIKFACLGIGGMFVYDFYLYSDVLLLHGLNPDVWAARGLVNALTVPLLAVAASRSAALDSVATPDLAESRADGADGANGADQAASAAPPAQLALSRPLLLHSAALLGSACYLLAMGLAASYLRYAGDGWGAMMRFVFLFGAVLLLAGILFSGSARASLKVLISKHFYRYRYDYREEWLRLTRALSQPGGELGSRSIAALARLVDSPAGALWIRRESGRCEALAHWQMPLPVASEAADSAFCRFIEAQQWLVDVAQHAAAPERCGGVPLPSWLAAWPRAWLLLPLLLDGRLFGFVLLQQPRSAASRRSLDWEVIDLLKIAGSQVASYLAQRESASALALARQFDAFNRMSTFVVHDLKNLVSQLSLMMSNADKHRHNPAFQRDMDDTVDFAVQKMRRLLHKLSRGSAPARASVLAVEQLLRQAVALKSALEPAPLLEIEAAGLQVVADAERLERVFGHLIQNAIEATPRGGAVRVRLRRQGPDVVVDVSDTGQGMSPDFIRERLFQPFDSTKPAGMGIGAFESREYIVELGGRLEVRSAAGQGSTFELWLPAHQAQAVGQAA